MATTTIFQGHGLTVSRTPNIMGGSYYAASHDLDDADLPAAREAALAEIDDQLRRAAPGATRIEGLEAARREIADLRTRAEIEQEEKERIAREEAQRAEEHEAEVRSILARFEAHGVDAFISPSGDYLRPDGSSTHLRHEALGTACDDPRMAEICSRVDGARQERIERKAREEKAKADAEEAARRAWVSRHGSPHLRRLMADGYKGWEIVYRDERLALERPGWTWESRVCGELEPVRATSVLPSHLVALDEARKVAPDAKLMWLGDGAHCDGCDCPREADDYGKEVPKVVQGVVLAARFEGRDIVRDIVCDIVCEIAPAR